jgi:hypothetical protein
MISLMIISCAKEDDEEPMLALPNTSNPKPGPNDYLKQWVGSYEGSSYHWSNYPRIVNGQMQIVTNDTNLQVKVDVQMGSVDSSLIFMIAYSDSTFETHTDLFFDSTGSHFSEWGGGSSYGSLTIDFSTDQLSYDKFQKCGIPCNSGINFNIVKE